MNQTHLQSLNGNLAKAFPELVRLCLKQTSRGDYARQLKVLTRRHGLDGAPINTLEELGAVYGVSRQRIEQIQSKVEKRIQQLLDGSLKRRGWDICPSLRSGAAELKNDLSAAGLGLSRTRFQSVIRKRFGNGVRGHWFALFAQTLGYHQLAPSSKVQVGELNELWLPRGLAPQRSIDQVFRALDRLKKSPEGTPVTTLLAALRSAGHIAVDEPLLRAVIQTLPRLELTRSDMVRVRTGYLSSGADQAWRVLEAQGKPLRRDEIARRVNAARVGSGQMAACTTENIVNQMSADERFVTSGKSGLWGLKVWGTIKNLTIVEAMQKALHAAGEPLTMRDLIAGTRTSRPDAADHSIKVYAGQRADVFVRVGGRRWALAQWCMKESVLQRRQRSICSEADFVTAVELARDERICMPLKDLVSRIIDLTGVSEATARQRLAHLSGVRIEKSPGQKGKLVSFDQPVRSAASTNRITQREMIQNTIHDIIKDEQVAFGNKKDLYRAVNRRTPCQLTTFYRYLREMKPGVAG